jgi:hypothetical protein
MAEKADASSVHPIARLAESGEDVMRDLVALPLRMLAGAFGICEALLRTAADAVSDVDPINERVIELERRLDSLDAQVTAVPESSATTSPARKRTPGASDTAAGTAGPA